MKVKGVEFKMKSPAQIYFNWEFDIICPLQPPGIEQSDLRGFRLDDEFVMAHHNDLRERISKIPRIALHFEQEELIEDLEESFILKELLLYKDNIDSYARPLGFKTTTPFTFSLTNDEAASRVAHRDLLEIRSKFETRHLERVSKGGALGGPLLCLPEIKLVKRTLQCIENAAVH